MFAGGGMGWREGRGHGTGARSCSRGGGMGWAPPAFAGAGFRREDTGGAGWVDGFARTTGRGRMRVREGEGWVGGFVGTTGGEAFLFAGGGMGWRVRVREGEAIRGNNGRGGMGWRVGEDTGWGKGMGCRVREDNGMGCRVRVREGMGARENGRGVVAFWLCCLLLYGFRAGAGKQRTYI